MKKKMIAACVFAAAVMSGASAGAEFYNDLGHEQIDLEEVRDGVSFVAFDDYFDMPLFDEKEDGDGYLITSGENELRVVPGSDTAQWNGEEIKLPAAPYVSEHGLCMPARAMFELVGAHVSYDETFLEHFGPVINVYWGNDVREISGTVTDRMYGWSATVPEGYYYYTDSVDANVAWIDNFNGIKVEVKVISPNEWTREPNSINLDGFLKRTEKLTTESGWQLILTGEIYSNASDETRAELNTIMDTFAGIYTDGAENVSNISDDGSMWEIESIRPGVAFDVPLGWDVSGKTIGYSYGERISVNLKVFGDITAEELNEQQNRIYEYFKTADSSFEHSKFSYGGYDVDMNEYEIETDWSDSYVINFYIEDRGYVYYFTVRTTSSNYEFDSLPQSYKDKARESMYTILNTLRLSDPGDNTDELKLLIDFDKEPKELSVGDMNFTIPGYLDHVYINYNEYELMSVSLISADSRVVVLHAVMDEIGEEDIAEAADEMEPVTINGIEFLRLKNEETTGDEQMYASADLNTIILLMITEDEAGSQYAEDLRSVVESVHK